MTERELVTAAPPEATKAQRAADSMFKLADGMAVDSTQMYELAGSELQSIKERHRAIEAQRVYLKEPFLEGGRRIDAFFKGPLERLDEAARLISSRMLGFKKAEDEKAAKARREAEERAAAERRELERQRQAAEAEQRRLAEEQRRAHEEADRRAADARKAGDEAAAREAEEAAYAQAREADVAAQAAAEASQAAADRLELAEIAPVSLPTVEPPKASGISTRQAWKAEVTDLHALIKAAAARLAEGDPTLAALLIVDTKALGQLAKALKGQARIPGVRVFTEESLAVRSAA